MLKIPIVHADSVSICFFARAAIVSAGGNIIFRDNNGMDTNRDSAHQSQNEDNFATFSLGLEFLNEAENNGKGDSASAPSRFASFASDLMHNSTGYVIKQLVHAFSCALSSYGARGKFGEHSGS